MIQPLDFVFWVQNHPNDKIKIIEALSSEEKSEMIIDRHRLSFDPEMEIVMVDRASEEDPLACKILKCKIRYLLLIKAIALENLDACKVQSFDEKDQGEEELAALEKMLEEKRKEISDNRKRVYA